MSCCCTNIPTWELNGKEIQCFPFTFSINFGYSKVYPFFLDFNPMRILNLYHVKLHTHLINKSPLSTSIHQTFTISADTNKQLFLEAFKTLFNSSINPKSNEINNWWTNDCFVVMIATQNLKCNRNSHPRQDATSKTYNFKWC